MFRYNTSFRVRTLEETLAISKKYAKELGIVRVTDTTRLDRVGLPVYASIRPSAMDGSLCVNSGKGLTKMEAMVGAYMEAIEFAMAEPGRSELKTISATPNQIYEGDTRLDSILDFCPKIGASFDPDAHIECVSAKDLISGGNFLVPAQLVFYPSSDSQNKSGPFSNSTNGLASGNSLTESLLHGLFEVIERDALSFQFVKDNAWQVTKSTLPKKFLTLVEDLHVNNLELIIHYAPNELSMPVFLAYIIDKEIQDPMFINAGYGCHTEKEIALSRAVAEAVQSRLVLIHGARDDIPSHRAYHDNLSRKERYESYKKLFDGLNSIGNERSYTQIPEHIFECDSLEAYFQKILQLLKDHGFRHVLYCAYTKPDDLIQVSRILIPRMEFHNLGSDRLGPRLNKYVAQLVN